MKKLTATLAALVLSMTAVFADGIQEGLADPVVTPLPVPSPIGGFYLGAMATKTETGGTERTATTECVYPERTITNGVRAQRPVKPPQCVDVTTTTLRSILDEDTGASAFAGYRADLGGLVLGAEIGSDGEMTTLSAQAGFALTPNLLAYGFAGGAQVDDDQGATYGAGVDYVANSGWLIGAQVMQSDDLDVKQIGLRLGYSF